MDIFRLSESQEPLTWNCDASVQNSESGIVVQTDLGESLVEPTVRSIPAHIGKSIILTQGVKVTLPGPAEAPYNGRSAGFHRHGFTIDQKEWLDANVGVTVGHHLWEEGQGDWLYQGSRWAKGYSFLRGGRLFLDFRIRDRRKAILFKLTWFGTL